MEACSLRRLSLFGLTCAFFCSALSVCSLFRASAADAPAAESMHFTNGAIATAYDHCGEMDLCAKLVYGNGNVLSIYSEGAAYCQPYDLHFVYADSSDKTL